MEPLLLDWIWKILVGIAVFLLVKYLEHEKRIQKMEDVQGMKINVQDLKIDELVKKVDQMEKELNNIKTEVHINKDLVNQMKSTIYNVNSWILEQDKK